MNLSENLNFKFFKNQFKGPVKNYIMINQIKEYFKEKYFNQENLSKQQIDKVHKLLAKNGFTELENKSDLGLMCIIPVKGENKV
jgi:hypothetical protein